MKSSSSTRSRKSNISSAQQAGDLYVAKQTKLHSFFPVVENNGVTGRKRCRVADTPPSTVSQQNEYESPPIWTKSIPFSTSLTPPTCEQDSTTAGDCVLGGTPGVQVFSARELPKKKTTTTQLYLDLGQTNFGKQTICETCGMLFVHGMSEDAIEHKRVCDDYRHGVSFHSKTARVVSHDKFGIVIEIRPSDSYELRQKLKRIESIVDNDIGFILSNEPTNRRTAYLYVRNKKVLGLAIAETITTAFVLKSCSERSNESRKAMVGIQKIWVHHKYRKQCIASILVDAVRSKFIYGLVVPVQMLSFSSPTLAGMHFARRYVHMASGEKSSSVLVYDCC